MTYAEAEKLLKENKSGKAYREDWGYSWSNHHIFYESGNGMVSATIMVTTCDWPHKYYPSKEDLSANDFIYEP